MALATKLGGLSRQSLYRNKVYLYNAARCYSDNSRLPWNYLWRPDHYSEKDHDKIAEKYHLHPKDYKPYPNNEQFVADYPALPMIGPAAKDPYYPYDIPVFKKNYHELLHDRFEIIGADRIDYGVKPRINRGLASLIFIGTLVAYGTIMYLADPYPVFEPVMERQYPQAGKVHYSFEPAK